MDEDYRRRNDADIREIKNDLAHVEKKVDNLQVWVTENAEVTRDVRDLLSAFHISGAIAKWIMVMVGAIALALGTIKNWFNK